LSPDCVVRSGPCRFVKEPPIRTVVLEPSGTCSNHDLLRITEREQRAQVRTIAEEIELRVKSRERLAPLRQGLDDARWVLLDIWQFVVHVFLAEARRYYDLERLWADAPRVERAARSTSRRSAL